MAPGDEYSAGGGGKLKLKGSKVSEGRVEKKKAKKAKKKESENQGEGASSNTAVAAVGGDVSGDGIPEEPSQSGGDHGPVVVGKTETERKYEETRRKRLQERLKREGVKTHKERVEELNKYLSGLSEHHDMYVFHMSNPTTWYTKALVLVADKFAGRKSDPVEIPLLLLGERGRYSGFTGFVCPWELLQHITTSTATFCTAGPETSHRADSKANRRTRAMLTPDHQTYRAWHGRLHEYTTSYDQEGESDKKMGHVVKKV